MSLLGIDTSQLIGRHQDNQGGRAEFSQASALNPAQLLAVLDDYAADAVAAGSAQQEFFPNMA